jgi:ATP-binding cassette, subfamily B, bacterial PglK
MPESPISLVHRLWSHLRPKRQAQVIFAMGLSVAASSLEIISIGSILPLLSALINPGQLATVPGIGYILNAVGVQTHAETLTLTTALFCSLAVLAGAARFALTVIMARLSYAIGSDFSLEIYMRAIRRPFIEHLKSNSSDIISAVSIKSEIVVRQFLFPVLTIASSGMLSIAIVALLFAASPMVTVASSVSFGLLYLAVHFLTRSQLHRSSLTVDRETNHIVKKVQEGLGSVRDITLDGSHDLYRREFLRSDTPLRKARSDIQIISQVPRYVIEAGGLVFFGLLAYILASRGVLSDSLPSLGVLALGLQRLLPTMQQAYAAWACIQGAGQATASTLELLNIPVHIKFEDAKPLSFVRAIELEDLHFAYGESSRPILNGIGFQVLKGSRLGIIGKTGSGKSTLLDVMMGLLPPTSGFLRVDGVPVDFSNPGGWHELVAHVPQTIFIVDASIAENIALGVDRERIDMDRVRWCVDKAHLGELIDQLPLGLDTVVGERGAWLSGGQRQRIGIARALYRSASVLVLDEATSALDESTERAVMDSIEELEDDVTIIMVAHKMASLRSCTQIIELRDGVIVRTGSYEDFVENQRSDNKAAP